MKKYLPVTFVVILFYFGFFSTGVAATVIVQVGSSGNTFSPLATNINVGDQVTWNWFGSFHSVTSTNTSWPDTGVNNVGFSFSHAFQSSGAFFYYCTIHGTPTTGMKGAIFVAAPNIPPTVTITNPASGTVLSASANVTIQASAADDGIVTNVQFLVGSTVLANKAAAPFFAVANDLPAGSYTLSAIASDDLGAKATNIVSINVVTPLALAISAPQLSAANFQFNYAVNTGLTYIVERSTNLVVPNWISIFTNKAVSNPAIFVDTNTTNTPGFYRVGRLPNP